MDDNTIRALVESLEDFVITVIRENQRGADINEAIDKSNAKDELMSQIKSIQIQLPLCP